MTILQAKLDTEDVVKKRQLEIEYFKQMQVYRKMPVQKARKGGCLHLLLCLYV